MVSPHASDSCGSYKFVVNIVCIYMCVLCVGGLGFSLHEIGIVLMIVGVFLFPVNLFAFAIVSFSCIYTL